MPPVAVGTTTHGNTFNLRTALSLLHSFTYSFAHSAYPQRIQNLGVSSMWSTPPGLRAGVQGERCPEAMQINGPGLQANGEGTDYRTNCTEKTDAWANKVKLDPAS